MNPYRVEVIAGRARVWDGQVIVASFPDLGNGWDAEGAAHLFVDALLAQEATD